MFKSEEERKAILCYDRAFACPQSKLLPHHFLGPFPTAQHPGYGYGAPGAYGGGGYNAIAPGPGGLASAINNGLSAANGLDTVGKFRAL